MSTNILLRRSAITGRIPTTEQLNLGELAINTADGKIYFKRYDPVANTESIIDISSNLDAAAILAELITVDGPGSGLDADTLDGIQGDSFLLKSGGEMTGVLNIPDGSYSVPSISFGDDTNTGLYSPANNTISISADGFPAVSFTKFGSYFSSSISSGTTGSFRNYGGTWTAQTGLTGGGFSFENSVDGVAATISSTGDAVFNSSVAIGHTTHPWADFAICDGANSQIQFAAENSLNTNLTQHLNSTTLEYVKSETRAYSYSFKTGTQSVSETLGIDTVGIDVTGNVTVSGTVDGRDVAADGAKLDSLEDGLDLTLTGKVTGTASSNTGVMTLTTELANTGVTAGTYGSSTSVPVITVDEDGRITVASTSAVSGVDSFTYAGANNTITLGTGDGSIFNIQTETEVTLTGKVTGTATSSSGTVSVAAELANTGVTAGSYGSSTAIPIITVDEDGRITLASTASVAGVDDLNWTTANNTLTLETGDGTTYLVPIEAFNDISANNITVTGTVDGRDLATDGSKLDLIEDGATADQTAADIRGLGFFDSTNDGTGSTLDADLLDGQHASDIIATAVGEAGAAVGNGRVDFTSSNGLTGSGGFNLNDSSNTSINFEHADTSSVTNVTNTLGSVITGVTFDTFGHTQTVTSTDLDLRYYTQTELNSGQLDNLYYTEVELDAGQLDDRYYTESELNSGQLNSLYYTESELNAGQLDNRYYTESESDTKFVDVTGDTMTGPLIVDAALTVNQDIIQEESRFTSIKQTTAATTQVAILSFFHASYAAAEVLVTSTSGGERHITKLLLTHDGTTAVATEYGVVYTGSELAAFDVAIAGSLLELRATPASSSSTVFKTVATLIDV